MQYYKRIVESRRYSPINNTLSPPEDGLPLARRRRLMGPLGYCQEGA